MNFLNCLKTSAVGFNLAKSSNCLKRSHDPILFIGTRKNLKVTSKDHGGSLANVGELSNALRKTRSLYEQPETKDQVLNVSNGSEKINYPFFTIKETIEDGLSPPVRKSKSNKSFGNKLFEDFVIIGADPEELERTPEHDLKVNRLTPKILYDFDSSTGENNIKEEK